MQDKIIVMFSPFTFSVPILVYQPGLSSTAVAEIYSTIDKLYDDLHSLSNQYQIKTICLKGSKPMASKYKENFLETMMALYSENDYDVRII